MLFIQNRLDGIDNLNELYHYIVFSLFRINLV